MKMFIALMLISVSAFANEMGPIYANGGISLVSNPQRNCGASEFSSVVRATYSDAAGVLQPLEACLNTVVIPLTVTNCGREGTTYVDSRASLMKLIKSGVINEKSTLVFHIVEDFTLTGINCGQ